MLKQINIKNLCIKSIVLFFTIFTIINMFPSFAHAEITNTVENRAKSWTMYNTLIETGCGLADRINANTLDKMNRGGSELISVGQHITGSDTGLLECLTVLKTSGVLKVWGYEDGNYSKFLTDLGYKLNNGWYENSLEEAQITRNIIKIIPGAFGTQNNANPPKDIQWYIYYSNLSKGCKINQEILYDQASQDDKNAAQSKQDKLFIIYKPNNSGGADKYLVKTDFGRGRDVDTGWGLPTNIGGSANCEELASKLNDNSLATAYASSIKSEGGNPSTTLPNSNPSPGTEEPDDACLSTSGGFAWIICPIGDLASQAIKVMDDLMYDLLSIPTDQWENSGAKIAWSSMVLIASSLIVLITLVGVASQVFNFDFVSAYTIRKILPKLFIGAIAIQLSWFLGTVMINISNDIGYGTQALIVTPFENVAKEVINEKKANNDPQANKIEVDNDSNGWVSFAEIMNFYYVTADHPQAAASATLFGGLVAVGVGIGSLFLAGPAVITTLFLGLISALIAILIALVVIALRYVLVLGLLVIMPLAIAAWILPSTKKWFDRWWDMFFALLAMFPIIIAFLSFGKVAAMVIAMSAS